VFHESEWEALCGVIGRPGWIKEERFSSPSKRAENTKELDESIEKWTSKHTAEKVVQSLQEVGVPAGIVQNAEDLANDPQLLAREFFVHLAHPALGDTTSDRSPIRFAGESKEAWKAAPLLGQDNRYVYMELLGLEEDKFSSFIERGIIG
jgi:crotonobetainyl-CoA:carnitine CoA-transferase CaiB-like acyl-CoA transferase